MPRSCTSLTLDDSKRMLQAGEAGRGHRNFVQHRRRRYRGYLIAFARQEVALIGSIDLAIGKAVTARLFDKPTSELAQLAQPGRPLFGIEQSNGGHVVIFGGGLSGEGLASRLE